MFTNKTEVADFLDNYGINNYTINDDLTVDVDGNVKFENLDLEYLPVNFNKVSGVFFLYNTKLVSLKGCPREVGMTFYCIGNGNLESLKYSPVKVGGDYDFVLNGLTSLDYLDTEVVGKIICGKNPFINPMFNEMNSDDVKRYLINERLSKVLQEKLPIKEKPIGLNKIKI